MLKYQTELKTDAAKGIVAFFHCTREWIFKFLCFNITNSYGYGPDDSFYLDFPATFNLYHAGHLRGFDSSSIASSVSRSAARKSHRHRHVRVFQSQFLWPFTIINSRHAVLVEYIFDEDRSQGLDLRMQCCGCVTVWFYYDTFYSKRGCEDWETGQPAHTSNPCKVRIFRKQERAATIATISAHLGFRIRWSAKPCTSTQTWVTGCVSYSFFSVVVFSSWAPFYQSVSRVSLKIDKACSYGTVVCMDRSMPSPQIDEKGFMFYLEPLNEE